MNTQRTYGHKHTPIANADGSTLLEVLLAIVIFVVGMLALASLQGNLTRSSSDANMRTVAANIAEETIEGMRAFEVIAVAAGKRAYDDIVDTSTTESRGGVNYTVNANVTDYFFLPDRETAVTEDDPALPKGVVNSSFKFVEVTVTWNTGIGFQGVDKDPDTDDRLGSGSITVPGIIPSISSLNNAKVASEGNSTLGYPPVNYTPGLNPDIVAISLGADKFKESTTPDPVVRRADELVETWFDVITYTDDKLTGATFLRREEFASISCECTLQDPAGEEGGRLPTTWNGAEYDEGATVVGKPFGESVDNKDQSQYCDVCCKDHHDTASGPGSYRPGTAPGVTGNHKHYNRNDSGVLVEVTAGYDYIEACRLIRKDGFFRVAQDFMLQSQTAFPEDYLDDVEPEVKDYSAYVTGAVEAHFEVGGSWPAHGLIFDGRDAAYPSALPTASSATSQQLRSRGIYTDVISLALQNNLKNCFKDYKADPPVPTPENEQCFVKTVNSPLEIYPFFDVQVTLLSRWTDNAQGDPVVVSNQELATDNTHSRGVASLAGSEVGPATTNSNIETGNVGLISIAEIAAEPAAEYLASDLFISANGGTSPPPDPDPVVSGTLVASGGTTTSVPSVEGGGGAACTRPTNDTFTCTIAPGSTNPTLTVGNYYNKKKFLMACSPQLGVPDVYEGGSASTNTSQFALPTTDTSGIVITIVEVGSC